MRSAVEPGDDAENRAADRAITAGRDRPFLLTPLNGQAVPGLF